MLELRKFLIKAALFAVPFLLYGIFIIIVDPYNYFSLPSPVDNGLKKEISYKLNYAMWKMLDYRQDPVGNILLGDSRMMSIDTTQIREISGEDYFNFAYGGGSLKEALETFGYAHDLTELKNVYIGLDLNIYNGSDNKDRVSEVLAAEKNPLLYITNNNTLLAATRLVRTLVTGQPPRIGKPKGNKEAFWKKQLDVTARVYFANYRDPIAYRQQLADLSDQCRREGINLVFIIFPSHMDLQEKIAQYGLEEANETFRRDLAKFGKVYDFAWDNEQTRNRDLFKDPYHFGNRIEESIIRTVWNQENHYVRIYGDPTVDEGTIR